MFHLQNTSSVLFRVTKKTFLDGVALDCRAIRALWPKFLSNDPCSGENVQNEDPKSSAASQYSACDDDALVVERDAEGEPTGGKRCGRQCGHPPGCYEYTFEDFVT